MYSDDEYESDGLIDAVIGVAIAIFSTFIVLFAGGTILDNFWYRFQNLGITMSPRFSTTMGYLLTLSHWFYYVIIFGMFITMVWLFKFIVKKHKYTRYDEEEEQW